MRRVEQRVAEFPGSTGERARPRRRHERRPLTGRRDASAQPDDSHAGEERRALRQSGGNPERWHETVKRND